jgi:GTPase SAR1 family protein
MENNLQKFYEKVGTHINNNDKHDYPHDECQGTIEVATTSPIPYRYITPDSESTKRWAESGQKFWACSATYDKLPPGLYKPYKNSDIGFYIEKQIIDTDELLILPDTASEEVINEIEKFWTLKDKFLKRGFIHKRGILLWGDPGSGKTATIQLMLKQIVNEGGIALFAGHPGITTACLQMIRRIELTRRIIVIMEDFESLIKEFGESEYLAMLDGESQISDVLFVATTNYPEKLDKRFIDRPSRFDTIKKIDMPNSEARKFYLKNKEPSLNGTELETWVDISEGMSIAHLKEMIISNKCYGIEIDEVVKRLNFMKKRNISSDDALGLKSSIGFISREDDYNKT